MNSAPLWKYRGNRDEPTASRSTASRRRWLTFTIALICTGWLLPGGGTEPLQGAGPDHLNGPVGEISDMSNSDEPGSEAPDETTSGDNPMSRNSTQARAQRPRFRPPRLVRDLGSYSFRIGSYLRSLSALRDFTRAPFISRTSLRISADTLSRVFYGGFPEDGSTAAEVSGYDGPSIRVVTWNIERGLQYHKILQALRDELAADIYILQEVDRDARRTKFRDVASSLARELDMHLVFGIEFQELVQGRSEQPALHGQATLSRYPVREARVLRFENQPKDWSGDWFQPRHGGRMALVSEIETPRGVLVVYNVHLESRGKDEGRALQMEEISQDIHARGYQTPILVAGDLNTSRGLRSPVFAVARKHRLTLFPFGQKLTLRNQRKQKDWILGAGLQPASAILHTAISASDHKPISAVLSWTDSDSTN